MNCPRCQTLVASSQKFCGDCGEPLPWFCQECGGRNPPKGRYCGACGAQSVVTSGSARQLSPEPAPPDVERRQLTVMFADLAGSTTLSTRLEPEDYRDLLHAWRDRVTGLVVRYGGRITTHLGDGVVAFFGYPRANEVDAERAVRSSLAIVAAAGRLRTGGRSPERLRTRVGLATGPVIVGDLIGAGSSLEWSVVSETTNIAARLQSIAESDMVVIDDLTRDLSGGMFEYSAAGPVDLRGIPGPVRAWAVLRESAVETRFEALRTRPLPLVGREDEADLLQRRWAKARAGIGHAVVLVGEAGLGKSRLIAAFEEHVRREPGSVLRLSCSPHYQDTPLYPLIRHFEGAAGFVRTDTPSDKIGKLQQLLAETSDLGVEETAVLADLLSIAVPADVPAPRSNELTFKAVLRHVEALAFKAPLLAIVEDFHWADPSTNALLDALVNEVERMPALLVISTRPEKRLPWSLYPQVTTLLLNGLDRRQAAVLVRQVVGEGGLADEAVGRIVERAQGVPLFLEELTRSVLSSDPPGEDGDRTVPGGAVPTSLNALLMARLDQLGNGKEVAQASAVIGREFSFEMLRTVSAVPAERLEQALAELSEAGLIVPKGPPASRVYVFYHALIQEAAYGSMLRDRRRALHLRYAQALEKDKLGPASSAPELLAAHFAEAGAAEKAVEYYLKAAARATGRFDPCEPQELAACFEKTDAAEKAVDNYLTAPHLTGRFALTEIVGYLRKALSQLAKLPVIVATQHRELTLLVAVGRALSEHRGIGDEEVRATFERADELGRVLGRTDHHLRVQFGLTQHYLFHSQFEKVFDFSQRILEFGRQTGNQHALVVAYRSTGFAKMLFGRLNEARDDLEHAIANCPEEEVARRDAKVWVSAALGLCLTTLGLVESGTATSLDAVYHAESDSHPTMIDVAVRRACVQGILRRDAQQVLELLARRRHNQARYETVHGNQEDAFVATWANLQTNIDAGLRERLCLTLEDFESAGYLNLLPLFIITAADVMESQGDRERADTLLRRAAELVERTNQRWCEAEIPRLRARLTNDFATSIGLLETSLSIARKQGALLWEVRAATDLAKLLQAHGRCEAGRSVLAPVLARVTEGFGIPDFRAARDLVGTLSAAMA